MIPSDSAISSRSYSITTTLWLNIHLAAQHVNELLDVSHAQDDSRLIQHVQLVRRFVGSQQLRVVTAGPASGSQAYVLQQLQRIADDWHAGEEVNP